MKNTYPCDGKPPSLRCTLGSEGFFTFEVFSWVQYPDMLLFIRSAGGHHRAGFEILGYSIPPLIEVIVLSCASFNKYGLGMTWMHSTAVAAALPFIPF